MREIGPLPLGRVTAGRFVDRVQRLANQLQRTRLGDLRGFAFLWRRLFDDIVLVLNQFGVVGRSRLILDDGQLRSRGGRGGQLGILDRGRTADTEGARRLCAQWARSGESVDVSSIPTGMAPSVLPIRPIGLPIGM